MKRLILDESRWSVAALHEWLQNMDADVEIRPTDEGAELWYLNSLSEGGGTLPTRLAAFYGEHAHIEAARHASYPECHLRMAIEDLREHKQDGIIFHLSLFSLLLTTEKSYLIEKLGYEPWESGEGEPND